MKRSMKRTWLFILIGLVLVMPRLLPTSGETTKSEEEPKQSEEMQLPSAEESAIKRYISELERSLIPQNELLTHISRRYKTWTRHMKDLKEDLGEAPDQSKKRWLRGPKRNRTFLYLKLESMKTTDNFFEKKLLELNKEHVQKRESLAKEHAKLYNLIFQRTDDKGEKKEVLVQEEAAGQGEGAENKKNLEREITYLKSKEDALGSLMGCFLVLLKNLQSQETIIKKSIKKTTEKIAEQERKDAALVTKVETLTAKNPGADTSKLFQEQKDIKLEYNSLQEEVEQLREELKNLPIKSNIIEHKYAGEGIDLYTAMTKRMVKLNKLYDLNLADLGKPMDKPDEHDSSLKKIDHFLTLDEGGAESYWGEIALSTSLWDSIKNIYVRAKNLKKSLEILQIQLGENFVKEWSGKLTKIAYRLSTGTEGKINEQLWLLTNLYDALMKHLQRVSPPVAPRKPLPSSPAPAASGQQPVVVQVADPAPAGQPPAVTPEAPQPQPQQPPVAAPPPVAAAAQ